MINVSGVNKVINSCCRVEVDEYVPISFRSYDRLLGVKYLRLGNFSSSLLELLLDPDSLTVRGFTLIAFDSVHDPMILGILPIQLGLPVIYLSEGYEFQGPPGAQRIDITETFSVGFGEGFLEIDLGRISAATKVVKVSQVEFYLDSKSLVGIRVFGLNPEQMSTLKTMQPM